jgi:hypothetical protein
MLYIKSKLKQSKIEGIGVFADEPIKKGTLISKFDTRFDRIFFFEEVEKMNNVEQEFVKRYGSNNMGMQFVMMGNERFVNHSTKPNIEGSIFGGVFSIRDIKKGEELTCNYYMNRNFNGFKKK